MFLDTLLNTLLHGLFPSLFQHLLTHLQAMLLQNHLVRLLRILRNTLEYLEYLFFVAYTVKFSNVPNQRLPQQLLDRIRLFLLMHQRYYQGKL